MLVETTLYGTSNDQGQTTSELLPMKTLDKFFGSDIRTLCGTLIVSSGLWPVFLD